jgi:hypothetical protein
VRRRAVSRRAVSRRADGAPCTPGGLARDAQDAAHSTNDGGDR